MIAKCAFALCLIGPAFAGDLVAHEWGTFTSVAGPTGAPVPWAALSAPSDLPCFVHRLSAMCVKCAATSVVRMETPVTYFYSPRATTVSVNVKLPSGVITEWYPEAAGVPANLTYGHDGNIDWGSVRITPGAIPDLLHDGSESHYYPARNTDSAALRVGSEQEKLIFYRGVADQGVVMSARLVEGTIELRNTTGEVIPFAVLFENRGGRSGYRVVRRVAGEVRVARPELDGGDLPRELEAALVGAGLFTKEASAMVDTWRDTWFEEGLRVFYVLPRKAVDEVLPLKITPAPDSTVRVFVGRVEMLSPEMEGAIRAALASGDTATLAKCGRFLEAYVARMPRMVMAKEAREFLEEMRKENSQYRVAPCRRAVAPVVTQQ
jgi:hypothetical protein